VSLWFSLVYTLEAKNREEKIKMPSGHAAGANPPNSSAEDIKRLLGLVPHPREGGCFVRTYESGEYIPASALDPRYNSPRLTGTAIYYLLEPHTFSEMHKLRSDEIFHFYLGDPVEILQLSTDGSGRVVNLGTNLAAGERPQVIVPHGVWQGSRLAPHATSSYGFALLGCTVSPGFEFEDYEEASRAELLAQWPAWAEMIQARTHR
jgi:predicted cupin superfamily sugar epimerase